MRILSRVVVGVVSVVIASLLVVPVAAAVSLSNVLVFHKTAGYQHPSIPAGVEAIRKLGRQNGFHVTATADASQFNATNLARFQAVVWLSTTGDVLNEEQQAAFEAYIGGGGGYVGVHAAADTEYSWAWYGGLVGAYFDSHPANQSARIRVEDAGPVGVDLARGRPVEVSSVDPGSPHAGPNAVDGNPQSRWASARSDPQWITVDLGAPRGIDRVRLNWETAYARAYRIQTSPDNEAWTTIYETTTGDGGIDDVPVSGTGRYVRVEGTQRATQWGYSLWDLKVIGPGQH